MLSPVAMVEAKTFNTVGIGYAAHTSGTLDSSPNKFDYSFLRWDNVSLNEWGSSVQFLELDNPFKSDENQQGEDGVTTLKHWVKLNYNLMGSRFHIWTQNYLSANEIIVEDNFYYGIGMHGGNPSSGIWEVNVGLHHLMGKNPADRSMNGFAGAAFSGTYVKPFKFKGQNMKFIGYAEGFIPNDTYKEQAFSGLPVTWEDLGKDSVGYLATATLDWSFYKSLSASLTYKNQSDYAGYSADTNHIFLTRFNWKF
jgi:hypothetical protein